MPEGTKTEPQYLQRLSVVHGLNSVHIRHSGSTNSLNIVQFALDSLKSNDWDRVYCVFDGDVDANLTDALGLLRNSAPGKAGKLVAILSVPCVEFWFLLHFIYTSKAYTRMANKSPCAAVQDDLKKHLAYQKNDKAIFDKLQSRMEVALANGKRLVKEQKTTESPNPITHMHELVEYLVALRTVV